MSEATMSPDGRFIAILIANKNGRIQLGAMDLSTKIPKIIGGFSNADISHFHWVNNDRLVFSTADKNLATGENKFYPGLYAVNRDGSDPRTLIDRVWGPEFTTGTAIKKRVMSAENFFYNIDLSKNSESVFVAEPIWDAVYDLKALSLIRINTKTALTETFNRPGDTKEWLIDQNGVPRINVTSQDGIESIFYLDPKNDKWRKIAEAGKYDGANFEPYAFGPDGVFYVVARKGRDTSALFRYNLDTNQIDEHPVVSINGYDFHGNMIFDYERKKLLGVYFLNDASATVWLDDEMKKTQTAVDNLLPATINQLSLGRNGLSQYVLIRAYSDIQPSIFLLYDTKSGKLDLIGSAHLKIDERKMATQDMVRYKARDGLEIPAYITLPKGDSHKNLPMVVLVHGGPYLRGARWGWDAEVQFLASRGYVVLQPEFRGSTGFGFKHFRAGWKQWGLAMQNDIADGAKWAIEQGIADPKRICIAGASYGGYATLMGLARNPELFRCGVNWVGVTDINLMFDSSWNNDASAEWQRYGMPVLIGDKIKDAAQINATSPVNIADRIKQPLFLAYGGADRRVPIAHGKNFLAAVQKSNKNVEWIEYLDEGHGWGLVKTRLDFWTKVDDFLRKNTAK
ncbi:MAG: S9 family peptidase [Cytophaga sp.]|nr:S9 family peptidase [Undibacterium sp.]